MHPIVLILLAAIVIAAVMSLISLSRSGSGSDTDPNIRVRRLLVIGLAILLAINLAMAGFGWFMMQNGPYTTPQTHGLDAEGLNARLASVEARLSALELAVVEPAPVEDLGTRIIPSIDSTILRSRPAGDALSELTGGTQISVAFCMARREAGQYWCEVRTPHGDTGWVPRSLIVPAPPLVGETGG